MKQDRDQWGRWGSWRPTRRQLLRTGAALAATIALEGMGGGTVARVDADGPETFPPTEPPPAIVKAVIVDYSEFVDVKPEIIHLDSARFVMWPDSGLGCDTGGYTFPAVLPGWYMTVQAVDVGGAAYHTNNDYHEPRFCRSESWRNTQVDKQKGSEGVQHAWVRWNEKGWVREFIVGGDGTVRPRNGQLHALAPTADHPGQFGIDVIYNRDTDTRGILYGLYRPDGELAGVARSGKWPVEPHRLPDLVKEVLRSRR
jgi:hypothetical protein